MASHYYTEYANVDDKVVADVHTGKGCPTAGHCYFRSDDWFPNVPGTGCNHTAGRRPGLPPVPPSPSPSPSPPPVPVPPPPGPPLVPKPALGYQPNLIFILTDDQDTRLSGKADAYSDIGSMEAMPSLQKNFLQGGVRMENGFVATPICCPSRTETFSGRWGFARAPTLSSYWCSLIYIYIYIYIYTLYIYFFLFILRGFFLISVSSSLIPFFVFEKSTLLWKTCKQLPPCVTNTYLYVPPDRFFLSVASYA